VTIKAKLSLLFAIFIISTFLLFVITVVLSSKQNKKSDDKKHINIQQTFKQQKNKNEIEKRLSDFAEHNKKRVSKNKKLEKNRELKMIEDLKVLDKISFLQSQITEKLEKNNLIKLNTNTNSIKTDNNLEKYNLTKNYTNFIKPNHIKKYPANSPTKSKLSKMIIIIDDISFVRQVKRIKSLNMVINLSFLPPNKNHPNSSTIAKRLDNFIVHLPLEPFGEAKLETNTLLVSDSNHKIESEIKKVKRPYPNVQYMNNHMGSKFTTDSKSVMKLLKILNKHNIKFIDSKTIASTKVLEVGKKLGLNILQRDIFLDNKRDISYIKNQIKKAIQISKDKGISISIGHPYSETLLALSESKHILKNVELVYIKDIY